MLKKKNKNKNRLSLFVTLGAASLLVGAGVAAYFVLVQRNASQGNAPTGAELIPQDALVAVSLSTDSGQWKQLREYGTPESQAAFDKQLASMRDTFLTANGYNYQQDIQPWLGKEVMIAFLSSQTPQSSSVTPLTNQSTVIVLPIDNPLQAQKLLEKPNSAKTAKFVERSYKGIQIRETQSASLPANKQVSNLISTTVLGRSLVVTTDARATERIIDTYKGTASMAATPGYMEALSKIKVGQPFARIYVNIPVAAAVAAANSARSLSPQNLAQLQQLQGLSTTVTLEQEGIHFQGVSWLKPNSEKKLIVENNAKIMPKRLPSETLMMMSGGNLQRLWYDYSQNSASNPITPINPDFLREGVKSNLGVDLDQDLLSWMKSEFSLSLIPTPQKNSANFGAGLVLMVQASDRSRADKALKQMDEYMVKRHQFQLQETKVKGQTIVNWISPLGSLTATRGWLDGNVAFVTVGGSVTEAIVPKPAKTLAENQLFQQTITTDGQSNNGHFFIDLDRTLNSGNLDLLKNLQNSGLNQLTNPMRAIGVTAGIQDNHTSRFDIFVMLKKASNPSTLPSPSPSLPPGNKAR